MTVQTAADPFLELVAEPWEPFNTRELPPFPVGALPPAVAAMVNATAEHTQTPPDLAAVDALGVLSAATLGTTVNCGAWTEEVALYLLPVMPSGDRKSTVLKMIAAPLREIERERYEDALPVVRDQKSRKEVLEIRKRELTKQLAKEQSTPEGLSIQDQLAAVCKEMDEIGEPIPPQMLADDVTPEALGDLLWHHGQIAVLSSESALIDNLAGRYSEGKANLHLVCAAYEGEPHTINRKGHEPRLIKRALATFLLTVQPHVLERLVDHDTARAQGLVARFAYARPGTLLGQRKVNPERIPRSVVEGWAAVVRHAAHEARGGPELTLSDGADWLLTELRERLEPRLSASGDLRPIGDWATRHHGRVARIAGHLHQCGGNSRTPIGEDTMRAAVEIGDYLLKHGVEVLTGPDSTVRKALAWLTEHGKDTITQRDLQRGPLNGRGKAEEAAGLAEQLTLLGALRPVDTPPSANGRPAGPTYEVHPELRGFVSRGFVSNVSNVSSNEDSENDDSGGFVSNVSNVSSRARCKKESAHADAGRWRIAPNGSWLCDTCYPPPRGNRLVVHEPGALGA